LGSEVAGGEREGSSQFTEVLISDAFDTLAPPSTLKTNGKKVIKTQAKIFFGGESQL